MENYPPLCGDGEDKAPPALLSMYLQQQCKPNWRLSSVPGSHPSSRIFESPPLLSELLQLLLDAPWSTTPSCSTYPVFLVWELPGYYKALHCRLFPFCFAVKQFICFASLNCHCFGHLPLQWLLKCSQHLEIDGVLSLCCVSFWVIFSKVFCKCI